MKRRRTAAVAGLLVAGLAFTGGCASPRGTASALSPVHPVSSPVASSPAVSSPAVSSPAVSSPAAASTRTVDSTQIDGAVTADFERQLVLSYTGGDCDVSARAEAIENGSTITAHVLVTVRNEACEAVGYARTATAQLSAPWSNRVVLDVTGATVPVIDGALLLRPSWLPDGYQGGAVFVGASDGEASAGQSWALPLVTATSAAGVASCKPSRPAIALGQGYGLIPPLNLPLLPGRHALADGTPVTVDDDQGNLQLFWTPPGHPTGWTVSLVAAPQCAGEQPLSLDTLLKVANGLH